MLSPPFAEIVIKGEYHCIKLFAGISLTVGCQVITQIPNRERCRNTVHADILPAPTDDVVGFQHIGGCTVQLWRLRDGNPQFFADFSFALVLRARPLGCPAVGGKGFSTVSATCSL